MVEVFKTNVKNLDDAEMLIDRIHQAFGSYRANFDLDDCDRILRVECAKGLVKSHALISLLKSFGFHAAILPGDEQLPNAHLREKESQMW